MKTLRHLFITLALAACITSAQASNIVFMIGEDEYHTWETLPEFAAKDVEPLGHHIKIINGDATDKNLFPGLIEALRDADLLFVSVRRRTLPKEQLDAVRAHLAAGKPLVGIRTASHAFALPLKQTLTDSKLAVWPEFDAQVLGGNYANHHRGEDKTTVTFAGKGEQHPILAGINVAELIGNGSLYKNAPLAADSTALLTGTIPNQPSEPIAWTHRFGPKQARVFYTSLGHPDDFKEAAFRKLLLNGIAWALGQGS
jgi:type 1 glutamine amidotransferase